MTELTTTSWSEVDNNNNQTPPAGWPSTTMLPTDVEPTARANMGALKRFWNRVNPTYAASVNTTDTFAVTPTQAITGYGLYEIWSLRIAGTNTSTSPTLNISALGPTVLKKYNGAGSKVNLTKGDIRNNQPHRFFYDGSNFILVDPVNAGGKPYMAVYLSSNQTGNQDPIPFDTVIEDSDSIWNNSSHRAVPTLAGLYAVTLFTSGTFSSATTGQVLNRSQLRLNGATGTVVAEWNATYAEAADTTGGFNPATLTAYVRCNGSSDYIDAKFLTGATGGAIVGARGNSGLFISYIGT